MATIQVDNALIENQPTARPQQWAFRTVCFSGTSIHGQHLEEDARRVPTAYCEQDAAALSHPVLRDGLAHRQANVELRGQSLPVRLASQKTLI